MTTMKALSLHITGVVQGVGFRPYIYNLAKELNLAGWVLNASDGVHIVVEGPQSLVDSFPTLVENGAPPASAIESVVLRYVDPVGYDDFEIRESEIQPDARTLISPDMATCPACAKELFDNADRRYRYPFINCTDCGPRFTIIEDIPYDRPLTTMKDFPMCEQCAAEYGDPSDRRFHAQPDACFVCGPRLYLNGADLDSDLAVAWSWRTESETIPRPHRNHDTEAARSNSILIEAVDALHGDKILAIKGLGGFQLACNARSELAVRTLRERKHRWGKPLAVMFPSIEQARRFVEIKNEEQALLEGSVRPIVLLKRIADPDVPIDLAPSIAEGLSEIGVMLPYTPLHHLLLEEFYGPLVMTSGNLSDEPIAIDNAEALSRLSGIADLFLMHDRGIYSRYDDSVVRVVDGQTQIVRRARGYAPYPLHTPVPITTPILAVGPEQKNTFTLATDTHAFVSQHIGDLENTETLEAFEETEALYEHLFRIQPQILAHDLHPEYLSTKWAKVQEDEAGGRIALVGVQHHHAHLVAVTAEHNYAGQVIGVMFDGTGYGEDGKIWGGEVMVGDWASYQRFAQLRYFPLPGGAGAVKRPIRTALGLLRAVGLLEHPGARAMRSRLEDGEEGTVLAMIEHNLNSPMTSSMGRLFDAVASLIGVTDDATYEGSPAILLEAASAPLGEIGVPPAYRFGLEPADTSLAAGLASSGLPIPDYALARYIIDPTPLIKAILDDLVAEVPTDEIARRFHGAVISMIGDVATKASRETDLNVVALSGGCMMNRLIMGGATEMLVTKGFSVMTNEKLPVNDGCISFGQAISAHARLNTPL